MLILPAAANKADKPVSSSTGNYILLTTLDYKYRTPEIISPPRVPNVFHESTYVGLYSFIVAMIYISGGSLQEETFYRHMRRMNADKNTPIETTEKLVQTMLNDGYLSKSKDNSTGEELVEYHVGPRGKVEIGEEGVARIVKTIYGDAADEDLIKRLEKTLALSSAMKRPEPGPAAAGAAHPKKRKRPSRQQGKESDDAQEESGEEAEESEDE
jgi:ribosomal protein L12E/L44/L45/RPP1/RPP2